MSLLNLFPRSVASWLKSTAPLQTLDLFDPFDEQDNLYSRNCLWVNKPEFLSDFPVLPRIPQKYRIAVDCSGFSFESLRTSVDPKTHKLVVLAQDETVDDTYGDYTRKAFKKTYQLPENCEIDQMASFMTFDRERLIIEIPLKESEHTINMVPQTIDNPDNTKSVTMHFILPIDVDNDRIQVINKNRDLILRVEDRADKPDMITRFHYYQRTRWPENTRFDQMKCVRSANMITATAPLDMDYMPSYTKISIETMDPQEESAQRHQVLLQQQLFSKKHVEGQGKEQTEQEEELSEQVSGLEQGQQQHVQQQGQEGQQTPVAQQGPGGEKVQVLKDPSLGSQSPHSQTAEKLAQTKI